MENTINEKLATSAMAGLAGILTGVMIGSIESTMNPDSESHNDNYRQIAGVGLTNLMGMIPYSENSSIKGFLMDASTANVAYVASYFCTKMAYKVLR